MNRLKKGCGASLATRFKSKSGFTGCCCQILGLDLLAKSRMALNGWDSCADDQSLATHLGHQRLLSTLLVVKKDTPATIAQKLLFGAKTLPTCAARKRNTPARLWLH